MKQAQAKKIPIIST